MVNPANKILCFLLFFTIAGSILGQSIISGKLVSDDEGVPGISLLVFPGLNSTKIITYAITDGQGRYRLEINSSADSLLLSVKSLSFRDTLIWVANKSQSINLNLLPHVHEIREVNVRSNPISARGDTINYLVNSFARADDRSIGDVIGHMPGFEVSDEGQVFYQGQPIQKYYIEGLDLLEKRYSIANKNLPHKSVGSVEVLQNHQPVKMLENKIPSDGTSLNIKLKNDVAITGTMYVGAGFSPFLHDINLTPMLFQKKQQVIVSWQSNNMGNDLNTQHQPLVFSNGEMEGINNRKPQLLGISSVSKPQIEESRFLDNNANLLSYNHLIKISKGSELKINSSYYHDRINEENEVETHYFLNNQTVNVTEITRNSYFNKSVNTDLTFTQNEKNRYVINKFSFQDFWDSEQGKVSGTNNLEQKAETPHFSLANDLDIMVPAGNNFLRFYSFIDYNNSSQKISFSPGVFADVLNDGEFYNKTTQHISEKNLVSHNFIQFTKAAKAFLFETQTGFRYENQKFETFIEKDAVVLNSDSLQNQLKWQFWNGYIEEAIQFKKKRLRTRLTLPLNIHRYHTIDQFHSAPGEISKFYFSPSLYLKYEMGNYFTGRINVSYRQQLKSIKTLAQGYQLSGYRQMKKGINQLSEKTLIRFSTTLEYKNPVSGFFSNCRWINSYTIQDVLLKQKVKSNGFLFYDVVEKDNSSFMDNVSFEASQYFPDWQATIDFKTTYSRIKKEYLLNDELGWLTNQLLVLAPGITINCWKIIDLDYQFNIQRIKQKSGQSDFSVFDHKHKGSILVNPSKQHLFSFNYEYYITHQSVSENSNTFFADISYHFKPSKGKLKFRVDLKNIFNQSNIVRYYSSDISLIRSSYQIRSRQFLFTISLGL